MNDALGLGGQETSSVHVKSCCECRKLVKEEEEVVDQKGGGGHQKGHQEKMMKSSVLDLGWLAQMRAGCRPQR